MFQLALNRRPTCIIQENFFIFLRASFFLSLSLNTLFKGFQSSSACPIKNRQEKRDTMKHVFGIS